MTPSDLQPPEPPETDPLEDGDRDADAWMFDETDGDPISHPVVSDGGPPRPRIYVFGHAMWIVALFGVLAVSGVVADYVVLMAMLMSGAGLFALDGSRWRLPAWIVWTGVLFGVYRLLDEPLGPPWWAQPGLIFVIVVSAYGLWRLGRARLRRERRGAPLVIG